MKPLLFLKKRRGEMLLPNRRVSAAGEASRT
jgi:hypothetical protein